MDDLRLRVRIDELVCTGIPGIRAEHRDQIASAFTRELTRLLMESPPETAVAISLDAVDDLPPLPQVRTPRQLGIALARTIHSGIVHSGRSEELPRPSHLDDSLREGREFAEPSFFAVRKKAAAASLSGGES